MTTKSCKQFLDNWISEHYENSHEAHGKWVRLSRSKIDGGVLREFHNTVWNLAFTLVERPSGFTILREGPADELAQKPFVPNGWSFGIVLAKNGSVCMIPTNKEMDLDNVGNYHCDDCDGFLPSGIYEFTESIYESNFDYESTLKMLIDAGFVLDQARFDRYFVDFVDSNEDSKGPDATDDLDDSRPSRGFRL